MNAMTPTNPTSQHTRSVDLDQFTGTVSKDMKQWARDRQALFAPLLLPIVLMFIATVLFGFGGDQWNIGLVDKSGGSYAASLTQAVENSESNITPYFNIVTRDQDEAQRLVDEGRIHLVITIPDGFDQAIAARVGIAAEDVHPVSTEDFPRPAPRPEWSLLSHEALVGAGIEPIGPWMERWSLAAPSVLADVEVD